MRTFFTAVLVVATVGAYAQDQQIGIIDFYGLHKFSEPEVRFVLGLKEGDTLPPVVAPFEELLKNNLHVAEAQISVVCCDEAGKPILFVGIRENPEKPDTRKPPVRRDTALPLVVAKTYQSFLNAMESAVVAGNAGDDLSQGHSLMADSATRSLQKRFPGYAKKYLATLREVLHHSDDAEQRGMAAYIIGYAPDKRLVTRDLLAAMQDEDEVVRNSAARALAAIATLAERKPSLRISIPATPFVRMLHSVVWTDRNKALTVLAALTTKKDPRILRELREDALGPLVEMARWKSKGHAYNAFILLGRVAHVSDRTLNKVAWDIPQRDALIDKMVKSLHKKGKPTQKRR
jgi:hypothetical protein